MIIKTIFRNKRLFVLKIGLVSVLLSSFAYADTPVGYCKVYNPKGVDYYQTHTKINKDFCDYYLKKCNKEFEPKYNKPCSAKLDNYMPLNNTNPTIATMHVLYDEDYNN